ncbi:MAG: VOC family protein [Chloroflexota bacterium]
MSTMQQVDHIALGVKDLDERIAFFTEKMGMELIRMGTHFASGGRIAMLRDARGFKFELIEDGSADTRMMHIAFRAGDVDAGHDLLLESGCQTIRGPHDLKAARARTAIVNDPTNLQIQVVKYEPDSPDV